MCGLEHRQGCCVVGHADGIARFEHDRGRPGQEALDEPLVDRVIGLDAIEHRFDAGRVPAGGVRRFSAYELLKARHRGGIAAVGEHAVDRLGRQNDQMPLTEGFGRGLIGGLAG